MKITVKDRALELVQGDITDQQVDAIVNAANSALAGGGGVDGAIHDRGGPSIMEETNRLYPDGCETGSAVISGAGELTATYVIHAVGPIWRDGEQDEPRFLHDAYRGCLQLATENDCQSIAFPSLSTGAYRFPMELAARIALATAIEYLHENSRPKVIRFVLFGQQAYDVFEEALTEMASE